MKLNWKVENRCFCLDLSTSSLIAGYISLVWNAAVAGLSMREMSSKAVYYGGGRDVLLERFYLIVITIQVFTCIFLIIDISYMLYTIVLIFGLRQMNRGYVKVFLIYNGFFVAINIILLFLAIAHGVSITNIILIFINILPRIYFVHGIGSYYLKMDETKSAVINTV